MDWFLLEVFEDQVKFQCRVALAAATDLQTALTNRDITRAFIAVQNLLNAAANLGKAFWGQGGKFAKERKPLRDALQVGDDSALKTVTMRNNYEHYDERLDYWWTNSPNRNHIDFSLAPPGTIQSPSDLDFFRELDPSTGELRFWGEQFDLKAVIAEIQRLLPIVEAETSPTTMGRRTAAWREQQGQR